MYAQEMVRMDALPKGAAATASMALSPPVSMRGWEGRKGARCSATQIGLGDARQHLDILGKPHVHSPDTRSTTTMRAAIQRVNTFTSKQM